MIFVCHKKIVILNLNCDSHRKVALVMFSVLLNGKILMSLKNHDSGKNCPQTIDYAALLPLDHMFVIQVGHSSLLPEKFKTRIALLSVISR